jgi:hypothetical protein
LANRLFYPDQVPKGTHYQRFQKLDFANGIFKVIPNLVSRLSGRQVLEQFLADFAKEFDHGGLIKLFNYQDHPGF